MNSPLQNSSTIAFERSRAAHFMSLTKPELTFLSVLTALGGAYLGLGASVASMVLLHVTIGTLLVGSGAGALNQYMERYFDARMKRTAGRPIPSGRISPREALIFGSVCSAGGIGYLFLTSNILATSLAILTLFSYLFLYTPLKRITWLSTIVGGIPGALPPVIGWTAAGNGITAEAGALFAILFFWQMPHFFSLAWMYRADYERGGFKMLSVLDCTGRRTAIQITAYTLALLAASGYLLVVAGLGYFYLVGAGLIGVLFLGTGLRFLTTKDVASARTVFFASLAYLPLLLSIIVVDRL